MKVCNIILLLSFVTLEGVVACMVGVSTRSRMSATLLIHAKIVETGEDLQEQFRESLMDVAVYCWMSSLATLFTVLTLGAMYLWNEGFRKRLSSDPISIPEQALLLLLGPCIGFGSFAGIYGALWYPPSPDNFMQIRLWIVGIFIGSQALYFGSSLWRIKLVRQRESAAAQSEG